MTPPAPPLGSYPASYPTNESETTGVACSHRTRYEGDVSASCLRGSVSATSGCKELSCGHVTRRHHRPSVATKPWGMVKGT